MRLISRFRAVFARSRLFALVRAKTRTPRTLSPDGRARAAGFAGAGGRVRGALPPAPPLRGDAHCPQDFRGPDPFTRARRSTVRLMAAPHYFCRAEGAIK